LAHQIPDRSPTQNDRLLHMSRAVTNQLFRLAAKVTTPEHRQEQELSKFKIQVASNALVRLSCLQMSEIARLSTSFFLIKIFSTWLIFVNDSFLNS
jgi:hypothetical protein